MSKFKDRAEDEAARRDREDSDWYARQADLLFVDGAIWAARQPPTDAEVEAAAQAMFTAELAPGGVAYESDWNDPDLRRYWQDAARAALRAAQKVRVGQ